MDQLNPAEPPEHIDSAVVRFAVGEEGDLRLDLALPVAGLDDLAVGTFYFAVDRSADGIGGSFPPDIETRSDWNSRSEEADRRRTSPA